jgi:flagellar hook protein FlgE
VAYDDLGTPVTLDVYMTKTGTNTWEMDVYNHADASAGGGFPYSTAALTSQQLNFSGTTGDLTSASPIPATVPPTTTPTNALPIDIPNGMTLNLNISGMTQTAGAFSTTTASINGSQASATTGTVSISSTGVVSTVYADGSTSPIYQIQLGSVPDPDALIPVTGNVWQITLNAGTLTPEDPGSSGVGTLLSSSLESSTVDLATELTNMISAQSGYEANSKVFQTGSSLLEDLVNLLK